MALAAIDCVRRGIRNTRANRELVVVRWLSNLLLLAIAAAGLLPPLLVLGFTPADLPVGPEDWERAGAELVGRLSPPPPGLLAAGLATALVWTLAFVVFCFFQAGTYGILYSGDRQAPPGLPGEASWFRTWSRGDFSGWGGRLMWRFFWLANLYACLVLVLGLLFVVLVAGAVWAKGEWGPAAAIGLGCGGALPLFFLALTLGLWFSIAQADLPREGGGVVAASRRGGRVLGRRLGGVLLVVILTILASAALAVVFAPFGILIDLGLGGAWVVQIFARGLLFVVQSLCSSALSVVLAGSLIALLRAEEGTPA